MKGEFSNKETQEIKPPEQGNYRDIKPETNMSAQEAENFWNSEFGNASETYAADTEKRSDTGIEKNQNGQEIDRTDSREGQEYYTREEKIDLAGHSAGEWDGEVGNSEFHPDDSGAREDLEKYGQKSIEYKDGNPDFSKVSETTVEIDNMTSDKEYNFRQAYKKIAEKWNEEGRDEKTDWTSRDVKNWKHENHYDLHECADMKTMNLIPHDIHMACKHIGGRAECRRAENMEGGFDE